MMLQVHWVLLHYRIVVRSVNYEIPLFDRNKYYREFFVDFFYQNISEITKFLAKTCLERWNCFHVSLPPSLNACYVKSGFKKNNKKKNNYHDLIYQQILHDFELPFLGLHLCSDSTHPTCLIHDNHSSFFRVRGGHKHTPASVHQIHGASIHVWVPFRLEEQPRFFFKLKNRQFMRWNIKYLFYWIVNVLIFGLPDIKSIPHFSSK